MDNNIWNIAKENYKIQQIKEEWIWLIDTAIVKPYKNKKINIFEIGCYDGGSTYYLGNFAKNMITVDNNNPCRFDPSTIPTSESYQYIGGDSHDPKIISNITKFDWDFVFIDGDHSYEGVKADFYNVIPHLKKGTPVAFHDIAMSEYHHTHGCYVGEFWRDLKNEYNATKFEEYQTDKNWAGIGIVWT